MKKTLLAAALVTGFAGVAHAESSVTLYGLVDAGYGFKQTETKFRGDYQGNKVRVRENGVDSGVLNGNRWGLKGKEDLGNGTSAIFVLESGFNLNNGKSAQGGRLFGRQAYVGLAGDSWGTFTIGRQYNAADTFVAPVDPFGTAGGLASATAVFGSSLSERNDGVIKYVTPNYSGFQFGLGLVHSDKEEKTNTATGSYKETKRQIGVTTGLGFTSGPIYLGASFDYIDGKHKNTNPGNLEDVRTKTKAWNVGATYDFDVVKLHLMYGALIDGHVNPDAELDDGIGDLTAAAFSNMRGTNPAAIGGEGLRQHSWLGGLSAPVGDAGKIMFSYAGNTSKNKEWNENVKVKSHKFALGYRHSLSKRTSVYGVAAYGWAEGKERYENFNGKAKATATQAVVGLQHRF